MQVDQPPKIPIPSSLIYRPLPADLDQATNRGLRSVFRKVDAENMFPCRNCLQDGKIGDTMELLSYDPWLGDSPYRQSGPIFVHAEPKCEKATFPAGSSYLPEQQRGRQLSVRAFNGENMMVGFDVIQGEDLVKRAESFFEQKGEGKAEYVHVHYPAPGCFAVRIDRGA